MSKHNSNVDNGGKVLSVGSIILHTTIKKKWLSLGIITTVCGAVITALYPPLVLGRIVDTLAAGCQVPLYLPALLPDFRRLYGHPGIWIRRGCQPGGGLHHRFDHRSVSLYRQ